MEEKDDENQFLKAYMCSGWIKMMLKHPFLLGSMLEIEKYEELDEELGRTLRAFSCFFLAWLRPRMKRRENERVEWYL